MPSTTAPIFHFPHAFVSFAWNAGKGAVITASGSTLTRLVAAGLVVRVGRGRYDLAIPGLGDYLWAASS